MDRRGAEFTIASLSWESDGKSLVFLALWCRSVLADPYNVVCQANGRPVPHPQTAQLRDVGVTGPGLLSAGRKLLSGPPQYQSMVQTLVSADGKTATVLGSRGRELAISRRTVPGGRFLGVVYQRPVPRFLQYAALSSDGSGRYIILNAGVGSVFGWVSDGRFHAFARHQMIVSSAAW